MARYTGTQSILNAVLGEYQSKGFRLADPDDHILELYYQDDLVSRFSQSRATVPAVHDACQEYLIGLGLEAN